MTILYILLVLLIVTRAFGEAAQRLGQPALTGELLSGVVLGLVAARFTEHLPILAGLADNEVFHAIRDLGIFFLMLLAGIELQPRELAQATRSAMLVALAGMLLPLGLGFALGMLYLPASEYRFAQALFIGVALSVTAVPVAIKVMRDVGRMDTAAGRVIVSAAVIDDVLSLLLLAVLTGVIRAGTLPDATSLLLLAGKVALFFAITIPLGRYLFPWLARALKRACQEEFELSGVLVTALAYALLAEALSMHFIIGAFMAGLFFGRGTADPETYRDVRAKIAGVTTGFLGPVFFASIGLDLDLSALNRIPVFVLWMLLLAVVGKVLGAGLAGRLGGLSRAEALVVGVAMNARGAVELVIANVALQAGLFSVPEPVPAVVAGLFSSVVTMAVLTTLVTPVAMRWLLVRRAV